MLWSFESLKVIFYGNISVTGFVLVLQCGCLRMMCLKDGDSEWTWNLYSWPLQDSYHATVSKIIFCSGVLHKVTVLFESQVFLQSITWKGFKGFSPAFWGQRSKLEVRILALLYFFLIVKGACFSFSPNFYFWNEFIELKKGGKYLVVCVVLSSVLSQARFSTACYWLLRLVWLWNVSNDETFITLLGLLFHLTDFTDRRFFLIILVALFSGFVISDSIILWNMWVISGHFQKIPFQIGRQREF